MREHYTAVVELLAADPFSAEAAALRAEIEAMERKDVTLFADRIRIFAEHSTPIGTVTPAERRPAGVMLT